jgi:serine/threonine protein kinase
VVPCAGDHALLRQLCSSFRSFPRNHQGADEAPKTTSIDVWSVGCILAELLGGKPIFKGRDYVDQLNQILHYLGTPSEDTLRRVGSPRAQDYIRSLPIKPRIPFQTLYPHANPLALDLLGKMLCFDPAKRISCEEALNHPYLQVWHDPADEPSCETVRVFLPLIPLTHWRSESECGLTRKPRNSTSASKTKTRSKA